MPLAPLDWLARWALLVTRDLKALLGQLERGANQVQLVLLGRKDPRAMLGLWVLWVLLVQMGQLVLLVLMVRLVLRAPLVPKVKLGQKEQKARLEMLVQSALQVNKAALESRVSVAPLVKRALKGQRVPEEMRAHLVLVDQQDLLVVLVLKASVALLATLAIQGLLVTPEILVKLDQTVLQAPKAQKATQEPRLTCSPRGIL